VMVLVFLVVVVGGRTMIPRRITITGVIPRSCTIIVTVVKVVAINTNTLGDAYYCAGLRFIAGQQRGGDGRPMLLCTIRCL
jgi:hypothetical protein